MTTITFRVDETTKKEAAELYNKLGLDLSTALNMFLKESIRRNGYPCSFDIPTDVQVGCSPKILSLIGKAKDLGDMDIDDLYENKEDISLWDIY